MQKVQYAIEIVDRWSAPYDSFERKVGYMHTKHVDPFKGTAGSINDANKSLDKSNKHIKDITQDESAAISKTINWGSAIKAVGGSYLALQAGKAIWSFTKDAVIASAQIEKYNVTLKTMLGSTGAARDRMQEYFDIAKKTPFELSQVVEAGNQLQAIGRYSAETLTNLGDLAAASGKPIEQVMSAYSKLATGQKGEAVNMFRDLLISTEDWVKATGKGIKKNGELEASTEEMIAALPGLLQGKGYLGMMAEQAKTTEGQISNLKDGVFQLKVVLGDMLKPALNSVMGAASGMVGKMREWVEVPVEQKIASEKAELNVLVESLIGANDKEDERKKIILELQSKYPEFLGNLDAETATTAELRDRLKEVNAEYDAKIRQMSLTRRMEKIDTEVGKVEDKILELTLFETSYDMMVQAEKDLRSVLPASGIDAQGNAVNYINPDGTMNWAQITKLYNTKAGTGQYDNFMQNYDLYVGSAEAYKAARLDAANQWGTDDISELRREQMVLKKQREIIYGKLMEEVNTTAGLMNIKSEPIDTNTGGSGAVTSTGSSEFQKAQDTITGGGKNVKIVNINIGSMIEENNNMFTRDQDPADADDFMSKLIDALASVVNDVNVMVR